MRITHGHGRSISLPITLLCSILFVCWFQAGQRSADGQAGNSNIQQAQQLVSDALEAELQGFHDRRNELLAEAIRIDPSNRLARWHSGQLLVQGVGEKTKWKTIQQVEAEAAADSRLIEYESIRRTKKDDLKGNEAVAEWCRRNGLENRANAHWSRVLQLNPTHRKAIGKLGLRNYQGRLLTRVQISAIKDRERAVSKLRKKWRPELLSWRRGFERKEETEKNSIRRQLKEIACPELIGLFESILSPANEELSLAVVDAVDNVSDQIATESLIRHAVFSKWRSVRGEATKRLKGRPMHGYVPILIGAMMAPLEFQAWNVRSPFDDDQVLAMNYTIGQQGKHVDRMVRGAVNFVGSGDDDSAEEAREEILERIQEANEAREKFNRPLSQVLQSTTGQSFETNPVEWNDWWNDYNEYHVSEFRPVLTSFRRASRIIVATRPFACFPAGTEVSTESGKKPIEEIRVGDRVLSKNPFTGELRYQPVLQTTVRDSDAILEVTMGDEKLRVTRGHPMWVNGHQWQMAKQLQPGQHMHGALGPVKVRKIRDTRMKTKVYNLVVGEFHTYFVGDARVLVHDNTLYTPPGVSVPGQRSPKAN